MQENRIPTIDDLKAQARRLRGTLAESGRPVSHAEALEMVARQYGYRDWNTIHAAARRASASNRVAAPVALGDRVRGHYLGQAFTGEVIGLQALSRAGKYRVTLQFDEAVDVVTFASFSLHRRRVVGNVDTEGRSTEKTSDGRPQLELTALSG